MKAGDEEVGAEALLLLGTAQQELRNDISYGVAPGAVDQASRAWLQLLGHIMGTGDDAALIDQLLTAAEAAAASVNAATDNPVGAIHMCIMWVLLHLRTLHVLLRQHGAPAAAAAAAALLTACGASQAKCSACGRACLTISKVDGGSAFTCESTVALFPRVSCPSPASAGIAPALTQPASSAEPKRRKTGNGIDVHASAALQPAGAAHEVASSNEAAKQHGDGGGKQAAAAPVPSSSQLPASEAPVTRASRSRARRAQKEGQPAAEAGPTGTAVTAASAPAPAGPSQPAALDGSASIDGASMAARAVSSSISQAAIGTAQPLLIRIKQDPGGDGSAQPQSALPILPLTTGASGGGSASVGGGGGGGSSEAGKAAGGGGGGLASAQLRRSGRSTRKEGKAAGGSGGSSPSPAATPPPAVPSGAPPAPAVGGVSRTVTSLSHGGRPAGPAISSPRDLQIALSPYRAVITSGNVPIPPGRRVQKASSDTALGRRSAATRSTTSPVVPDGALALLQTAAEQAYRRTASDPTNYASSAAAAAVAAIAAEARPKQTVSTGAPNDSLPVGAAPRPPPSNTVSTGAAPPAVSMDVVAAALGLIPNPSAALLDSVATLPLAVASAPAASSAVADPQATTAQQPATAAAAERSIDETNGSMLPPPEPPSTTVNGPSASAPAMQQDPAVIAGSAAAAVAKEGPDDQRQSMPATRLIFTGEKGGPTATGLAAQDMIDPQHPVTFSPQQLAVEAKPTASILAVDGGADDQAGAPADKEDSDVLQAEI